MSEAQATCLIFMVPIGLLPWLSSELFPRYALIAWSVIWVALLCVCSGLKEYSDDHADAE